MDRLLLISKFFFLFYIDNIVFFVPETNVKFDNFVFQMCKIIFEVLYIISL